jgi:hypothetical protein
MKAFKKMSKITPGAMVQVISAEFADIKDDIAIVVEELAPSEETGDLPLFRIEFLNRTKSANEKRINFDALPRFWPAEDLKVY